jgi:hypothetical protein
MLRKLSREVSDCYAQAHDCAEKAVSSPSAELREAYARIERSWLALARSYEVGERIRDFSNENDRRQRELYAAEPFFCVALRGGKWVIEATWPDDSTELVDTFNDYFEALSWLSTQAGCWLDQRVSFREDRVIGCNWEN